MGNSEELTSIERMIAKARQMTSGPHKSHSLHDHTYLIQPANPGDDSAEEFSLPEELVTAPLFWGVEYLKELGIDRGEVTHLSHASHTSTSLAASHLDRS